MNLQETSKNVNVRDKIDSNNADSGEFNGKFQSFPAETRGKDFHNWLGKQKNKGYYD